MNDFIPLEFFLSQNYPNPFKDKTVIKYCVGYKTRVQLTIHNSEGKVLEKLIDEVKHPGTYEIKLNASAADPGKVWKLPDGYYFYRLDAGEYFSDKKWLCKNSL
ncbi:MAG: T9SS type A sorting domain-containing protein [Ignavibacteria bacterium]|nr:T9SS type A sorting domain-containing protein [Ignavibacteria bacterium]